MPDDATPTGDVMTHRFDDQKILQPKDGQREQERASPAISQRPPLPDHGPHGAVDRSPPSKQRG